MVSSWCAGLLLFVATASSLACPFFTTTVRGILALHWVLVNYATSGTEAIRHAKPSDFTSTSNDAHAVLLSICTALIILEFTWSGNKQEYILPRSELISLLVILLLLDVTFLYCIERSFMEISLITLLALTTVTIVALRMKLLPPCRLSYQKLLNIKSSDMFSDSQNIFHFLGLLGEIHYLAIVGIIMLQIPFLQSWQMFRYLIYISRSMGTLSMLFCPVFFGGFIQALKTLGAKIGMKRLKIPPQTNYYYPTTM